MTSLNPLVQIQIDFTELFLMILSTKIAQMVLDKKCLLTAFPLEPLLKCSKFNIVFYRNVWHDAHYQNCTNGLEALNKKAIRAIDKKYLQMTSF